MVVELKLTIKIENKKKCSPKRSKPKTENKPKNNIAIITQS